MDAARPRRGDPLRRDRAEPKLLLDRLFARHEPAIREWIDRGRYSKKAREARKAPAPKLRNAA
jgi:hypothetical protein